MTFGTESDIVNAPAARPSPSADANLVESQSATSRVQPSAVCCKVALLTGGGDKPYALGLASALVSQGCFLDFIGSDDVDSPELHDTSRVEFLNLRGDRSTNVSRLKRAFRILIYYGRLIRYAATAKPRIFHILWNNKFEFFDRTALMLYYKLLGKKVVLTAHNVNAGTRDGNDSGLNRLSLKIQYRLSDHVFVHTEKMKGELVRQFGVANGRISVIPLGINNTVPVSSMSAAEARRSLGIGPGERVMLFFGRIAPYKGLDYLITALVEILKGGGSYRLVIAGKVKGCQEYWGQIQNAVSAGGIREHLIEHIRFVPDEQTELYFKSADVLVLPYTGIFQSGVLVLSYSFGLPVIAADVGSLKEEIIEGKTGYMFRARDSQSLANAIETYFSSDLFKNLELRRQEIRDYANERYSWNKVAGVTTEVYSKLLET